MGGGTSVSVPPPTAAETALQQQQTQLLQTQNQMIQSAFKQQNLLAPFEYSALGLTPSFDKSGAVIGFTQDPTYAAIQKQQLDVTGQLLTREQQALAGNLPIDPSLTTQLNEQEQKIKDMLNQQLGPGWETSTPGSTAFNQWSTYRSNVEHSASIGDLSTAEQLALGMQGGLTGTNSGFLQNASGVAGAGFGAASATGQVASGYNNPIAILENTRNMQMQANLFNAQQQTSLFGGLGQGIGSLLGMGLGGWASNPSGMFGTSSKFLKDEIDDAREDFMLEALDRMPVRRWRYKKETGLDQDEHIGPYAEDFNRELHLPEKPVIFLLDAAGAHHGAIKALKRRVEDLEEDSSFLRKAA